MVGNGSDQKSEPPETSPGDTFALIGHEIRAELIHVLGNDDQTLSELRSRLDTDVEPSQLHYHLQKLVGHFVEQTDDGYQLNNVGHRLSWSLRAGTLDRRQEQMTVPTEVDCYYCGGPIEVIFDRSQAWMECIRCEHVYMTDYYELPLYTFEDEAAAFSHYSEYITHRILSLGRGVCPNCGHLLSTEVVSFPENRDRDVNIEHTCNSCRASWWQSVGMALLADSALRSFYHEHGVDIFSTPHWELEFAATDNHVTVRSTDPWEVVLKVTLDGDTLELVVDGDLNVVERNRLSTANAGSNDQQNEGQSDGNSTESRESGDSFVLADKTACLKSLRRNRWPGGVTCPGCDSTDTIKQGTTRKGAQRYRCHQCDSSFNDLTGTIFAGRGLSLPEMFYIIRAMNETETTQIARQLDRSYKSVLTFVHEVQAASDGDSEVDLSTIREADE